MAQLHLGTHSADAGAVEGLHGVLGVTDVFELDEGEAGRATGHPDLSDLAEAEEHFLYLKISA
jgi:hypothetical protein